MSYPAYMITSKNPALTAVQGADETNLREVVAELSGRDVLGFKSVRDYLRRNGRVYIAVNRDAPGRERFGPGFIIERVREDS